MLNKLLIKIVKKVGYVQELETRVEQLKAVETRLREEKGDAVIEKKRAALKLKYLESVVIDLIQQPHMVFADAKGKFISIDEADLDANKNKYVNLRMNRNTLMQTLMNMWKRLHRTLMRNIMTAFVTASNRRLWLLERLLERRCRG